jgi:DNA-binding transcriptional LysR family regulator
LLAWARRILADWEGLRQEATLSRNQLTGTLRLGAIPTTLAVVPLLTSPCLTTYPSIRHVVFSLSAEQIIRQIDNFELDLGFTYLEDQRLQEFSVLPLYREHYVLLARDAGSIGSRASLDWAEIADLPLCLLTPNMQNRTSSTRLSGRPVSRPSRVWKRTRSLPCIPMCATQNSSASCRTPCYVCSRCARKSQPSG